MRLVALILLICVSFGACTKPNDNNRNMVTQSNSKMEVATFGAGCFWCVEAVFKKLNGVEKVISGYMGGQKVKPTYEEVCTGTTNHAEVIKVVFDSKIISFKDLLEVFWHIHDPTTLNRQGNDIGSQYRSIIFCSTKDQLQEAIKSKELLDQSGILSNPIVTSIEMEDIFYPAEDYHHDYYALNGQQPYCQVVIKPKIEKFREKFNNKLKDGI